MWGLSWLLWQREVGTRVRAHEREEELEAAKKAAAYQKSVRELKRQQQE